MSHPVEMTQHPPCLPTPESNPEDLTQEINQRLRILDFATLVLSHPIMIQAAREEVTKKTTSPTDPSMPGTSALSTDTHEWHASTGMPTTASWKDLPGSLATSSQLPIAESSRNTQLTSMNMTLSTG